jgi:hypothetical protein
MPPRSSPRSYDSMAAMGTYFAPALAASADRRRAARIIANSAEALSWSPIAPARRRQARARRLDCRTTLRKRRHRRLRESSPDKPLSRLPRRPGGSGAMAPRFAGWRANKRGLRSDLAVAGGASARVRCGRTERAAAEPSRPHLYGRIAADLFVRRPDPRTVGTNARSLPAGGMAFPERLDPSICAQRCLSQSIKRALAGALDKRRAPFVTSPRQMGRVPGFRWLRGGQSPNPRSLCSFVTVRSE